jgi:hypothetical protein
LLDSKLFSTTTIANLRRSVLCRNLNVGLMFTFKRQNQATTKMTLFPIYFSLKHSKPQQKKRGELKHQNYCKCMWKWQQWKESEKECRKVEQTNKKKALEKAIKKGIIIKIQNFKVPHIGWIGKQGLLTFIHKWNEEQV